MLFRRTSPGAHQVSDLNEYDVWPFKHRHWQFEIVEDARHDCWLRTGDLRDFWPLFPDDRTLVRQYQKGMLFDRSTNTHYVAERIMKLEMRRRRPDNDRTDLLRWLQAYDHNVTEVMARKRHNRHFDDKHAEQLHLESTISTRTPGPPPPASDASTQPLGEREAWMLQRAPDEPERVFRPEALPLRVSWKGHWSELLLDAFKATRALFLGRQPPVRTGLIIVFLAFATQTWLADALFPAGMDWTRNGARVLWSAFGLALLGLCWTCIHLWTVTRSTRRALPNSRARMLLLGYWGLMLALTPYILVRNIEPSLLAEWWDWRRGHAPPIEVHADTQLGRIVAMGAMHYGSADALEAVIKAHPELTLLQIESPGGFVVEGMRMASLVQAHHMDTYTREECASACTLVMAAGAERYYSRGGLLEFHRSGLRFSSVDRGWSPTDLRMAQYFRSRGIPEDFIQKAFSEPMWSIWLAPERDLFASGYITAWWADRKPGY